MTTKELAIKVGGERAVAAVFSLAALELLAFAFGFPISALQVGAVWLAGATAITYAGFRFGRSFARAKYGAAYELGAEGAPLQEVGTAYRGPLE